MKRSIIALVVGLILAGYAGMAHAVNFAGATLHVTVTSSIDISVVGSTVIAFPAVGLNNATGVIGSSSVTIRNDSAGLNVTLLLAGNDDSSWQCGGSTTAQTNAGADQFALRAIFNGATAPTSVDFTAANDYITSQTFPRKSSTQLAFPGGFRRSTASVFAGLQTGEAIAPTNTRSLWVQFIPATSSSVLFGSRALALSIVAEL